MDQKADSKGIIQTFVGSQEFLDQILEMMSLRVEDMRQGVEYLGQFQVQDLGRQVTVKSQDELLVMTLQCQMMKWKCKVNSMVHP